MLNQGCVALSFDCFFWVLRYVCLNQIMCNEVCLKKRWIKGVLDGFEIVMNRRVDEACTTGWIRY